MKGKHPPAAIKKIMSMLLENALRVL